MRLLSQNLDGEPDDGYDIAQCPYCQRWIGDLADDVADDGCVSAMVDIATVKCPACEAKIALVRKHTYHLRKLAAEGAQ